MGQREEEKVADNKSSSNEVDQELESFNQQYRHIKKYGTRKTVAGNPPV